MTLDKIVMTLGGMRVTFDVVQPTEGSFLHPVPIRNSDGQSYGARYDSGKGIFIDDIFGKNYDTSCFPGMSRDEVDDLRLEASETYGLVFGQTKPKIIEIKDFKYLG